MEDAVVPPHFLCPISMEIMVDPVTISTGVTYERRNIEKWLFHYQKPICPATMLPVQNPQLITPNHTLKRLILAWQTLPPPPSQPRPSSSENAELISLLKDIDSYPFKVSLIKKLRRLIESSSEAKTDFVRSGGIALLSNILSQVVSTETLDFLTFRSCEEALGVLHQLPLEDHETLAKTVSNPETIKSVAFMLQKGSAEARLHAVTILRDIQKVDQNWSASMHDQGPDVIKSLLELVSDEICTKSSSRALEVLILMLSASKMSRLRAVEAGAVRVLVELLPEPTRRSKCEKILLLIKLLCGCAAGRMALAEHGMGIAAVSRMILMVSDAASRAGVKILWLVSAFHPTEGVVEEMMVCGAVKRLLALLKIGSGRPVGASSSAEKVVRILKLHGKSWRRHPCCPHELKECLGSEI